MLCLSLVVALVLLDMVHADEFIWGEYADKNELVPNMLLSPTSWIDYVQAPPAAPGILFQRRT
jgi:hypothetical protein